ncbi:hypothetical protein H0H87_007066 [Tephrocybe sp. NHM501043]|nr:hypothetical protein H0H87_007066 [Tephrocybe sp. NHM501043]
MSFVTQPPSIAGEHASHHTLEPQLPSAPLPHPTCHRTSRMTRGRKKDLTIPPTRALVQQRDYRARRAQYVSDLEERVRQTEEENTQLRKELAAARNGQAAAPLSLDSRTAHASSELMHNLSIASASLARFHQLAFPEQRHPIQDSRPSATSSNHSFSQYPTGVSALRPASFPSPAPSPPYAYPISETSSSRHQTKTSRKRLYREDSPESVVGPEDDLDNRCESRASSPLSNCCGGIMDCRELIERVDSGARGGRDSSRSHTRQRTDSPEFSPSLRQDAQH